jgi:class 3 adenylate cyclase
MVTEIVDSTLSASETGNQGWARLLDAHRAAARRELEKHGGHEIHTTGDGLLSTFESPARAVQCGQALTEAIQPLGLDLRTGIHTGEVVVVGDKVYGFAVHLATGVAARAASGEVLVSDAVRQLLIGSDLVFEERGEHEFQGLPGKWRLFAAGPPKQS